MRKMIVTIGIISIITAAITVGVLVLAIIHNPETTISDNKIALDDKEKNNLISIIENWDLYEKISDSNVLIFNFDSCGNKEFDQLVERVNKGPIYKIKLNGIYNIIYTPNYYKWDTDRFTMENQSFCEAGAIYPRYAYEDKLLWAGVCSTGYAPEKNEPDYNEFQKCLITEEAFNNFLSLKIDNTTADTSNWQTYRNEEYGFEFKYPNKYLNTKDYASWLTQLGTPNLQLQWGVNKGHETIFSISIYNLEDKQNVINHFDYKAGKQVIINEQLEGNKIKDWDSYLFVGKKYIYIIGSSFVNSSSDNETFKEYKRIIESLKISK